MFAFKSSLIMREQEIGAFERLERRGRLLNLHPMN